jgi:hypothetical protein
MMEDVWTYRDETVGDIDLAGFSVEATDGGIGKIDEATYDVGSSYLVVDTGPWIFGKKVLLPAGVINRIDAESETVFVSLAKDEIKSSPEFDRDWNAASAQDEEYRRRVGTYYAETPTYRETRTRL